MLRDVQRDFAASLIAGDTHAAMHLQSGKLTASRRVEIYRHNVMTNLRNALRDIFPVINKIVGDAFFLHAADLFIRDTPSRSGDLNQFGREWPDFLAQYPHASELPYLPDVARLEWHWHEAFHAVEADALDLARLADIPADEHGSLRFQLHPSVRLISSVYPILRVWEVNQPEFEGDMTVDWNAVGDHLLIRRENIDARSLMAEIALESLPAASLAFLSALTQRETLEVAAEAALKKDSEFDLQGFLIRSVQSGVIVDFERAGA
jgi:hypothetical protein